jgi:hypothetical protein
MFQSPITPAGKVELARRALRRALIQGHFDQLALERRTCPLTDEEYDHLISRMARKGL